MNINSVMQTVKNWMKEGFVMVELAPCGGFGNIYSTVEEAIASVKQYTDFILYNPNPAPSSSCHWMSLEVRHNPYGENWTSKRMRGDGKGQRTKKVVADLIANYDAILDGTYTYIAPTMKVVKKRTFPQIPLQEFLVSQGYTKDNWEKSTHRYTCDTEKYLEGKTEEEKKAYEDLDSIDEIIYINSISKSVMMSAVKYQYMSLFASYYSDMYCGATLWYEDGNGNTGDIAYPAYENDELVLKYTDLKYIKGKNFKGCFGRFESIEEGIFEMDWEDLAEYMVDENGLQLKEDGTLVIYDHNCGNGDEILKDLMNQLDVA